MTATRQADRKNARTRGVTVTPLDFTAHEAEALAYANEHQPDKGWTEAKVYAQPWALATDPSGKAWLVSVEGTGEELGSDNTFDVHCSTPTSFAMFPTLQLSLTGIDVRACATGEPVDLADHIRVFGARLESNFRLWHSILTGVK